MSKYIYLNIFLILAVIYMIYKSRHAYHMLQLESYKNKRYLKWIKNNRIIFIKDLILIIPTIVTIFNQKLGLILNALWLFILIIFRTKNVEKSH